MADGQAKILSASTDIGGLPHPPGDSKSRTSPAKAARLVALTASLPGFARKDTRRRTFPPRRLRGSQGPCLGGAPPRRDKSGCTRQGHPAILASAHLAADDVRSARPAHGCLEAVVSWPTCPAG